MLLSLNCVLISQDQFSNNIINKKNVFKNRQNVEYFVKYIFLL